MSVLVGKLTTLIYGDFYCQMQNESKQKRPPWQEVVFRIDENCGRLSPQGGDLVQRYKRKTGTDLVPERRKMAALRDMFDFQRFSGNEKLCSMIRRAEEHSGSRLSFDDLDLVNAAGTPDILQKKNRDMQ